MPPETGRSITHSWRSRDMVRVDFALPDGLTVDAPLGLRDISRLAAVAVRSERRFEYLLWSIGRP